jgi:hypothetical protein
MADFPFTFAGAMGQLAKATGRWTQYIHYEGTAKVRH